MNWLLLLLAIVGEVFATSALTASNGFSRLWPAIGAVLGYAFTFYCFSLALKTIPVGVAYAVWAGVGIVLVALLGFWRFRQTLDLPALVGMSLIVTGVLVMQLFSKSLSS